MGAADKFLEKGYGGGAFVLFIENGFCLQYGYQTGIMLDKPAEGEATQVGIGMAFLQCLDGLIPVWPGWSNAAVAFGLEVIQSVLQAKRGHVHAVDEQDGFGWHYCSSISRIFSITRASPPSL